MQCYLISGFHDFEKSHLIDFRSGEENRNLHCLNQCTEKKTYIWCTYEEHMGRIEFRMFTSSILMPLRFSEFVGRCLYGSGHEQKMREKLNTFSYHKFKHMFWVFKRTEAVLLTTHKLCFG